MTSTERDDFATSARSGEGLSLQTLDERNARTVRALAYLVDQFAELSKPTADIRAAKIYCRVCRADAPHVLGLDPTDYVVEHKSHCPANHASQLLASDEVLRMVAAQELLFPTTEPARARQAWLNGKKAAVKP